MRSWGQAIDASGDVSVMPHACTSAIPNSLAVARDEGGRRLAAPADDVAQVGEAPPGGASSSATASQTVGTPAVTVTRSAISRSTNAAASSAPPKNTCLAPTMAAA